MSRRTTKCKATRTPDPKRAAEQCKNVMRCYANASNEECKKGEALKQVPDIKGRMHWGYLSSWEQS